MSGNHSIQFAQVYSFKVYYFFNKYLLSILFKYDTFKNFNKGLQDLYFSTLKKKKIQATIWWLIITFVFCILSHISYRFATYNHLMAFWRLIEPASHNMVRLTRVGTATVSEAGASGSTSVNNSFICHLKFIYDVVTYRLFCGGKRERNVYATNITFST